MRVPMKWPMHSRVTVRDFLTLTYWMSTMTVSWWVRVSRVWLPRIIIDSSLVLRRAFYCLKITMILGAMPSETNFTKVAKWCCPSAARTI